MIFYVLYRIGQFLTLAAPLRLSYFVASFFADIHYLLSPKERKAVIENLKVVLNSPEETPELKAISRGVYRNFAKYLVDFFRFSKIDISYIKKFVKVEGLSNIDEALKQGRGVIILSAHIGNWELGGMVLGKLGYRISAVVLTHQHDRVNDFFISQRLLGNFKSIEIGASLRGCYNALKNNELLALLGDRNFSTNGIRADFFGRHALMPKGPSALSVRTGAAIVCGYMIRQPDDTFGIKFEKPIYPDNALTEEAAVREVLSRYMSSMEDTIRRFPCQWYVFKEFWKHDENMRPDTVI